ncbi:MAG: translation elongation factor Ts [Alphaproteobacteria bacterium]
MAEITAALVKDLRQKTGAGMMDCKKALTETSGDLEAAVDLLRKQGLAAASKKAGRTAAEGLVAAVTKDTTGVLVEINSETDFVARNEDFQGFVRTISELALDAGGDLEKLKAMAYPNSAGTVGDMLTELVGRIGENLQLRRAQALSVSQGVVASYIHNAMAPDLGKIAVIVGLESSKGGEELVELAKQIAMHVAWANPQAVTIESLDKDLLERERKLLMEQAQDSGKPDDIIAKMVEGRLRKFYQDIVLLEQAFVIDNEVKVSEAIGRVASDTGAEIKIVGYVRFELGEGVEREESDLAAE